MREPGNMSGVARVTFPNDSGVYLVSFIRSVSHTFTVLGELTITVPVTNRVSTGNTFDTEGYSPRFRNSVNKKNSINSLQESTKTGNFDSEVSTNANKSIV
jgi:hypothetical protein